MNIILYEKIILLCPQTLFILFSLNSFPIENRKASVDRLLRFCGKHGPLKGIKLESISEMRDTHQSCLAGEKKDPIARLQIHVFSMLDFSSSFVLVLRTISSRVSVRLSGTLSSSYRDPFPPRNPIVRRERFASALQMLSTQRAILYMDGRRKRKKAGIPVVEAANVQYLMHKNE